MLELVGLLVIISIYGSVFERDASEVEFEFSRNILFSLSFEGIGFVWVRLVGWIVVDSLVFERDIVCSGS